MITFLERFTLLFSVGGGAKRPSPSISLSPLISPKEGISPENILSLSFNAIVTLLLSFKAIPGTNPKLLNLNQNQLVIWSNWLSGQILIKMKL